MLRYKLKHLLKKKITDGDFVRIEFIDNGIGIPDVRKNTIFNRRVGYNSNLKGMGIGLSLVKKIVQLFNGEIIVEDRIKGDYTKGSNFILKFPRIF